ncbi:MAG: transcriptional regulator [Bacteroidales bacterium]|nr:transcriptional regulator [Bacteroidales bacterium]
MENKSGLNEFISIPVKEIISGLNKIFDSRIRLGIMSVLVVNDRVDFNTLKELLNITDGNLASHIASLEKSGFIEVSKQFIGRKPNTQYAATDKGKLAFREHLDYLDKLLKSQSNV